MAHACGILKIFEMIQLGNEAAPTGGFCQMMGFIYDDCQGFAFQIGRFRCFSQLPCKDILATGKK